MPSNNKVLGTGLEGLLQGLDEDVIIKDAKEGRAGYIDSISIGLIDTNPNQPRKEFAEIPLRELAESIRNYGVIQPLILLKKGSRYMIIAGERRFRAAIMADLKEVPAVIRELTEHQAMEIALIENLQREDLNPIEAAFGMKELIDRYGMTQEALAASLGMSRPNLTNTIRLLNLSDEVIAMVRDGKLSAGHARALLPVEDKAVQIDMAERAANGKKSVRDLEMEVKLYFNRKNIQAGPRPKEPQSRELKSFVTDMKRVFGTRVKIKGNDDVGRIMIDYFSADDLQRIYELIEYLKLNIGSKK